ncbi:hypothetical protein QOT17_023891 [Balamuthia mandrillaris]
MQLASRPLLQNARFVHGVPLQEESDARAPGLPRFAEGLPLEPTTTLIPIPEPSTASLVFQGVRQDPEVLISIHQALQRQSQTSNLPAAAQRLRCRSTAARIVSSSYNPRVAASASEESKREQQRLPLHRYSIPLSSRCSPPNEDDDEEEEVDNDDKTASSSLRSEMIAPSFKRQQQPLHHIIKDQQDDGTQVTEHSTTPNQLAIGNPPSQSLASFSSSSSSSSMTSTGHSTLQRVKPYLKWLFVHDWTREMLLALLQPHPPRTENSIDYFCGSY